MAIKRELLKITRLPTVAGFVGAFVAAIGDARSANAGTQESIGALLVRQRLSGPSPMGAEFSSSPKSYPGNLEYYPEYLEANRFPGENQSQALHDYLLKKYSDRSIDVVVANSEASLNFLLKYRNDLFPHVPLVFYCASRPLPSEIQGQTALTGIVIISSYKRTLELALSLNPQVNQVFVVSGSLEHDKRFEVVAREELRGFEGRIKINYLTDLSPQELIARTANLPDRSLVLYAWQQARDDQGKVWESGEILSSITKATPVPIFGMSVHSVGHGIIGGHVYTVEAAAGKVAEVVRRIANGERAQDIPVQNVPTVPMFDWRELRRWGISEDSLPPGSVIQFRESDVLGAIQVADHRRINAHRSASRVNCGTTL